MTAAVLPLQGKVALVTGAGDGIGRGLTLVSGLPGSEASCITGAYCPVDGGYLAA